MSVFHNAIANIKSSLKPSPKMVFKGDSKFYSKYELQLGRETIGRFEIDKVVKNFEGGRYWGIILVKIDDERHRGKGYGELMYRKMLSKLPKDIDGLYSEPYTRHNNVEVPKIHKKLGAVKDSDGVVYIEK